MNEPHKISSDSSLGAANPNRSVKTYSSWFNRLGNAWRDIAGHNPSKAR